jgi:hypothetical protein
MHRRERSSNCSSFAAPKQSEHMRPPASLIRSGAAAAWDRRSLADIKAPTPGRRGVGEKSMQDK